MMITEKQITTSKKTLILRCWQNCVKLDHVYNLVIGNHVMRIRPTSNEPADFVWRVNNYQFPERILKIGNFKAGESVRCDLYDGDVYIYTPGVYPDVEAAAKSIAGKKSFKHYLDDAADVSARKTPKFARVANGKIYLPQFNNGDMLLVTYRQNDDSYWCEIRQADDNCANWLVEDSVHGNIRCSDEENGFTFAACVTNGKVRLPYGFITKACYRNDNPNVANLPVWTAGHTVIVEGPMTTCNKCGKKLRTIDERKLRTVCSECR